MNPLSPLSLELQAFADVEEPPPREDKEAFDRYCLRNEIRHYFKAAAVNPQALQALESRLLELMGFQPNDPKAPSGFKLGDPEILLVLARLLKELALDCEFGKKRLEKEKTR